MAGNIFSAAFPVLDNAAVVAALGYTPVNRAGDTMTGTLTFADGSTWSAVGINMATSKGITAGSIIGAAGGVNYVGINQAANGDITSANTGRIGFTPALNATVAPDTAISRLNPGILAVGTGAQGSTAGSLRATTVVGVSSTVATLPAAASNQGAIAFVTDATQTAIAGLGLAVVGGGTNKVVVYSDGTSWLII